MKHPKRMIAHNATKALLTVLVSYSAIMSAVFARPQPATKASLLDRIQIEDMIVGYYAELGSGDHNFGEYFVDDSVFLLNGLKYEGLEAIEALYASFDDISDNMSRGKFRMLLTNLQVAVDGDTATASMIWTGVMNEDLKGAPTLVEQGREYDILEKRDGVWYFKERVVVADSGLPDMFDDSYENAEPSKD